MKIGSIGRINFSIVTLCFAAILVSQLLGILPDERQYATQVRAKLCESIATSVSFAIGNHDVRQAGRQLELFAQRNSDLISAGMRRHDGELVVVVGDHHSSWTTAVNKKSDGVYIVPIANRQAKWGDLEIHFEPLYIGSSRFLSFGTLKLLGVVGALVGVACWFQLRRVLRYLDPSRTVPPRVREVLDSFAEGVVVLDNDNRIMLVNATFAEHAGTEREQLLGTEFWDLDWILPPKFESEPVKTLAAKLHGEQMQMRDPNGKVSTIFTVNSSPVLDDDGKHQGVMMAFTDVTPLERNRVALLSTLQDLSQSKKEISEQNEELRFLATRDPLTSCINRRTFFELFDSHWSNSKRGGVPLCALMVDIDFFKPINDTYGHSMGDEVLRQTGALLTNSTREDDVVCRYGGEEFAILMPGLSIEEAEKTAELIRVRISELTFPEFTITASLGVSRYGLGAETPQEMLDQADKCLYVAKRNGRNQVVRFDTVPEDLIVDESKISREKPAEISESVAKIPFAAVSALLSALSFRDSQTGAHSTRVSTYAALLAQRVMSPHHVFVVEMAAMLHDIGKVGVPDAILLKPGPLTSDEWELMKKHDMIGVEIINRSFKHEELTDIVKFHHYRFSVDENDPQPIQGTDIPLGARILTIVDSFDAMVSDRPYRKGMATVDAIAELRRCAGTQFDPELVEHFAAMIEAGCEIVDLNGTEVHSNDVMLSIGEQVERLVDAADNGDGPAFIALADRLRNIAHQHQIESIENAATHAIEVANEDAQLERLVEESFELLAACRVMRVNLDDTIHVE